MVLTWQKPKYAPFEEQAEHEQDSSTLVLLEPEGEQTPAGDAGYPANVGESANSFQVDLLDGWFKP
jgi:hypothetical protein